MDLKEGFAEELEDSLVGSLRALLRVRGILCSSVVIDS